jgi:hypothetical protein
MRFKIFEDENREKAKEKVFLAFAVNKTAINFVADRRRKNNLEPRSLSPPKSDLFSHGCQAEPTSAQKIHEQKCTSN